ncbi:hypothetical protein CAC42_1965 [Sphaceloma murrayae]|uniref:Uncharacterized protein n=1 Tax=Sphaceloma murrayae TaxID=2082308 RepID=A0A2K1QMK9_9PEZI|nr:hypothetical protein CAC42_1965 [Sphaceloma murrayae]
MLTKHMSPTRLVGASLCFKSTQLQTDCALSIRTKPYPPPLRDVATMGNCFGKSKEAASGNFKGQGRTLGGPAPANAPAAPTSAKVPAAATSSPNQGRTLGSPPGADGDVNDPKSAAYRAAEARKLSAQGKGKLGKQLDAQKKMTQADTLAQASLENRAARDMDAGHESRAHN